MKIALALLALCVALASPAAASDAITGVVLDPSGKPVPSALVRVMPEIEGASDIVESSTDATGRFMIAGLDAPVYQLRVVAPGTTTLVRDGVRPGAELTLLAVEGRAMHGRVLDAASRAPIAGATVTARRFLGRVWHDEPLATTTSGPDGSFRLTVGVGTVVVSAWGERWAEQGLGTSADPLEFFLLPGARVSGRVLSSDGTPIRGASVDAQSLRTHETTRVRTDSGGAFSIEGLSDGDRVSLLWQKRGWSSIGRADQVPVGSEGLELRMERQALLTFRLTSTAQGGVGEVALDLAHHDDECVTTVSTTRAVPVAGVPGRFELPVRAATYDVEILPADHDRIEVEALVFAPGAIVDLGEIAAIPARLLRGQVLDSRGGRVPGALVIAVGDDGPRRVETDSGGRFRLAVARSGLVRVSAAAEGFDDASVEGVDPEKPLTLVLPREARIVGRVLEGSAESPASGAWARAVELPGGRVLRTATVRADGSFEIASVPRGVVRVEAGRDGFPPVRSGLITVLPEDRADVGVLRLTPGHVLRGRVVAPEGVSPAGAMVYVWPGDVRGAALEPLWIDGGGRKEVRVGEEGTFEVRGLEPRRHAVLARHRLFAPAVQVVDVGAAPEQDEIVLPLRPGGAIEGAIRDEKGSGVFGATLAVLPIDGIGRREVTSGQGGDVRVDRLPPGSYRLELRRESEEARIVTVQEGQTSRVEFGGAPAITVTGRVLRGEVGFAWVGVAFLDVTDGTKRRALVDDTGEYRIGLPRPGRYDAIVSPDGWEESHTLTLDLPDEPHVVRDLVLPDGIIQGSVLDAAGAPIAHAAVQAQILETRRAAGGDSADAAGEYRIEGLRTGRYHVSAQAEGFVTGHAQIELRGDVVQLPFVLDTGRALAGRVVDPRGRPLSRATVVAARMATPGAMVSAPTQTDLAGRFRLLVPADAPVELGVEPPGFAPARMVVPPGLSDVEVRVGEGGRPEFASSAHAVVSEGEEETVLIDLP